ncbi:metallophosphatase [Halosquirtibacter laminarini]|uniref:Metallophosphatase n=2 Tax=Halosquirtibacter laminarini TaxID=3374600 RepID=A0AC61NJP4_9BACT|nr:metallophosphatase [Prolixibacteraceae bacterium]
MENRRSFLKKAGVLTTSALTASAVGSHVIAGNSQNTSKLTLLHTNDFHSHVDPFPEDAARYAGKGGLERRANLVQKIRNEGNEVLLLDAGDIFQGTPYFNYFKGKVELECMSLMGYDAATLGNHEFDNGLRGIDSQLQHADFPFVCSNYDFTNTILNGKTKEFLILNKGDVKVGIYGLGVDFDGLVLERNYGETIFKDPLETALKMEKMLKEEHQCDLIVCLSHIGYKYKTDRISDMMVAASTLYTNVIIGGHTHTFLDKPSIVENKKREKVIVSQTGWAGIQLGRIDIEFVPSKNPVYHSSMVEIGIDS